MAERWLWLGLLCSCDAATPSSAAVARFDAARAAPTSDASKRFCDLTFPPSGPGAKPYRAPQTKPGFGGPGVSPKRGVWTWINIWATWCEPCRDELPLLERWMAVLPQEGISVSLELLSIDADDAEPNLRQAVAAGLPGPLRWIRSEGDFTAMQQDLGIPLSAAIPIHILVDPERHVRCVRVGAVVDNSYGAVREILR